jgi:hypothetical protein
MAAALARHRDARPPVSAAESLEIRAACPAAEGRDADLLAARELIRIPRAYNAALLGPMVPNLAIGGPARAAGPQSLTPTAPIRN